MSVLVWASLREPLFNVVCWHLLVYVGKIFWGVFAGFVCVLGAEGVSGFVLACVRTRQSALSMLQITFQCLLACCFRVVVLCVRDEVVLCEVSSLSTLHVIVGRAVFLKEGGDGASVDSD